MSTLEPVVSVVARLREGELRPLRLQATDDLRPNALKSLYERGEGQELVRQQYTGRYPFELLQNANDAARDADARGRVHFRLTDTALIVADNGSGFGDAQVEAICSLGRSSKAPGRFVGHKGLGFKSVGEITDHPQIDSARASFQFSSERTWAEVEAILGPLPPSQKLPVYAFPFSVAESDFGLDADSVGELRDSGFTTVIRLPFNKGVRRITVEDHLLANLQSRLLLFLPDVDHLELRGTRGDFSAEVSRETRAGAEHVLLDTNGIEEEWLIYRGSVAPDASDLEPLGSAWTNVAKSSFAIAVPLDDDGQPLITDETFPLHVYFPTDDRPKFRIAVHAEWVLTMDRRQIATTPEASAYNRTLVEAVGEFLADVVAPDLVERTGGSANAIAALVPVGGVTFGAGASALRKRWNEALLGSPFLPTADGQLRRPAQIRPLPATLPDRAAAHAIATLDPAHTLRPDIEDVSAVRAFLLDVAGAVELGVPEFLSLMLPPTRESVEDYYLFVGAWRAVAGSSLVGHIRTAPSVLGINGQTFTPEHDTIFLPRERGDVELPEDLDIPVAYVPAVDGAQELLKELGVRAFEWRELIREYLIQILSDPAAAPQVRDGAMNALRAYHRVRLSGSEDLEPVLAQVLLPARTADRARVELRPAAEIYLSEDWVGSDQLEIIYGPFGESEFLDMPVPGDSEERETEMSFYEMLGVAAYPRISEAKPREPGGYMVGSHRHPHRGTVFSEWIVQPEVAHAALCPQGHPQSQQLRLSYRLDRHEALIDSRDPVRLIELWYQLAERWGPVYERAMRAVFHCVNQGHAGERSRSAPSLFAHTLRSRPWVPVDRGSVAQLVRPAEAWIGAAQTPRRIQERIPRITEAMYRAHGGLGMAADLGLTDAGRPSVDDLLALLESIAIEAGGATATTREIDQAARWVQRTLHDVLRDDQDPHPSPGSVRVLASQDGVSRFVVQPPYADDPLLRETFEKQRPILSAEVGLTKLTRYLSLVKLDDNVDTSALPFGEHHDAVYDTVVSHINKAKPYLLALVRAENSSAESRVRPALRTLELVVCDQLVLNYRYENIEVAREDAVCYIASRQERRGRRSINLGTAFLELDTSTGAPHWFPFGRQLAQHLSVPTLSDAFTMLLTASPDDRARMMADRQISAADIGEARKLLKISAEDEEELKNVLDALIPEPKEEDHSEPVEAALSNEVATSFESAGSSAPKAQAGSDSAASAPLSDTVPPDPPSGAPPVDYAAVKIVDAVPAAMNASQQAASGVGRAGSFGPSKAPSIQTEQENRRIGKRGEEVVYIAERERVAKSGRNPDSVHWVANVDELSSYDIISVDEDDQLIYIEVKSTKSANPADPFYISHAELVEASVRRGRFYIYRVTDVDAEIPLVTRWADPLGLISAGKGRLLLAKAQMTLALAGDDPEPLPPPVD